MILYRSISLMKYIQPILKTHATLTKVKSIINHFVNGKDYSYTLYVFNTWPFKSIEIIYT